MPASDGARAAEVAGGCCAVSFQIFNFAHRFLRYSQLAFALVVVDSVLTLHVEVLCSLLDVHAPEQTPAMHSRCRTDVFRLSLFLYHLVKWWPGLRLT